jgi:hypothetical protein
MQDIQYLKIGRHFRYGGVKIIVGRNERENTLLESLASPLDSLVTLKGVVGPSTLVRFSEQRAASTNLLAIDQDAVLKWAGEVTCKYSKSSGTPVVVSIKSKDGSSRDMPIASDGSIVLEPYRIGSD